MLLEGCQKKICELETLTVLLRGWTLLKVRGVMTVNMERAKSPWLCGAKWSPPRQMGWGVHVFEEPVLERPYWVLGLGVGSKVNEQTHEWSAFLGWLLIALRVLSGEQKARRLGDQLG